MGNTKQIFDVWNSINNFVLIKAKPLKSKKTNNPWNTSSTYGLKIEIIVL